MHVGAGGARARENKCGKMASETCIRCTSLSTFLQASIFLDKKLQVNKIPHRSPINEICFHYFYLLACFKGLLIRIHLIPTVLGKEGKSIGPPWRAMKNTQSENGESGVHSTPNSCFLSRQHSARQDRLLSRCHVGRSLCGCRRH